MYIFRLVNKYYRDAQHRLQLHAPSKKNREQLEAERVMVPVETYHYICKSAQATKAKRYHPCNQARIKEAYPEQSIEMGITPNGLGLIECLWPLLFHGHIARYVRRKTSAPNLDDRHSSLTYQLDQLKQREGKLLDQNGEGILDDDQFALGMERCRDRRTELTAQLQAVTEEITRLAADAATIPDKVFLDPAETSREVIQELAHEAFEEIVVYPDKIRVRLRLSPDTARPGTPQCIDIPRVKRRNSRNLPFWKARISTPEITPDTKLGVTYYLKSTDAERYNQVELVYHDKNMEVLLVGTNESVDKERSKAESTSPLVNEIIKYAFGPPPGYDRILEVNKDASMAKWIVPPDELYDPGELKAAFPGIIGGNEDPDQDRPETLSLTPPTDV